MGRILRFIALDIVRNRIVLVYTLLLAALGWGVFSLEDSSQKGMVSLLNFALLVVPLVSILFSVIYLYNSAEFIELILGQPVKRWAVWSGLYIGLSVSLILAFCIGFMPPLLLFAPTSQAVRLLSSGTLLTLVFVSLAFLCVVLSRDKAKGVGIGLLVWLYFAALYDGLVLFLLFQFSDYPIENAMVLLTATSPIDLTRILNLLELETAALMGYTGAIFQNYFGKGWGSFLAFGILVFWSVCPFWVSLMRFKKRDL